MVTGLSPLSFGENSLLTRSYSRSDLMLTEGLLVAMISSNTSCVIPYFFPSGLLMVSLNFLRAADLTM